MASDIAGSKRSALSNAARRSKDDLLGATAGLSSSACFGNTAKQASSGTRTDSNKTFKNQHNYAVRVKICGITRIEDAHAAVEAGAHALGFVFHAPSPRYIAPEQAAAIISTLPAFVSTVGVFVNRTREEIEAVAVRAHLQLIQLHGDEQPSECGGLSRPVIKAFRYASHQPFPNLADYSVAGFLVEARIPQLWGGSGIALDWQQFNKELEKHAPTARRQLVLAGGLDPQNVARAVSTVKPFAVDVSTGVEDAPGIKSPKKIKEFMNALRNSGNE